MLARDRASCSPVPCLCSRSRSRPPIVPHDAGYCYTWSVCPSVRGRVVSEICSRDAASCPVPCSRSRSRSRQSGATSRRLMLHLAHVAWSVYTYLSVCPWTHSFGDMLARRSCRCPAAPYSCSRSRSRPPGATRCGLLLHLSHVAWSVCLSVSLSLSALQNGRTDQDAV